MSEQNVILVHISLGLTGILFPDCPGSAYSAQRIYLALGFTVGFVMAEVLTVPETVWFMLGAVLLSLAAVFVVELSTQKFCLRRRVKSGPDSSESCDTNDTGDTDEIKDGCESISSKEPVSDGTGNSPGSGIIAVKIDVVEVAAL